MTGGLIGQSMPRVEDARHLRGGGRFVDDLPVDALEVAFVRSVHAHARIRSVEAEKARSMPGVVAVYTAASLAGRLRPLVNTEELRVPPLLAERVSPLVRIQPMPVLAEEEVIFVGQPVAMVVALNRYLAEDAAETVEIDYEPLPAVIDPEQALLPDSPLAYSGDDDNIGMRVRHGKGDVERAFRDASVVVEETFTSHRYVPSPMETRGLLAQPDPFAGRLTVWSSTQTPHRMRDHLAEALGVAAEDIRVVAVDTGGGFGQKGVLYVEELLVPFAALELRRPVRWVEDRLENLTSSSHAREQIHHISLAAGRDGRLLGVRDHFLVNLGCRTMTGLVIPYNSLCHLLGPYDVPAAEMDAVGVLTNTTFTTPYRGAGRPEAVFAMERAMDRLAAELGMDPFEVRARNLIRPESMPYRTGLLDRSGQPQVYDSGDYPNMLRRAVGALDLEGFRAEQDRVRTEGRHLGVGVAMYIEATGLGPFETASVSVTPSGRVRVATGAPSQGQGHQTTFAQIAAETLGVPIGDVTVVGGDTAQVPMGVGTIASRALVTAGNAVSMASERVRDRILETAANVLEADPADMDLIDGRVGVRGQPDRAVTLAQLMRAWVLSPAAGDGGALAETAVFRPPGFAVAAGVHVAVAEVDPETGQVRLLRYLVVHDAGNVVNPLIAHGQISGGVAQGIGGALLEEMIFDGDGQPRTTTFLDYLLPVSDDIPDIEIDNCPSPSPTNRLGVKGLGEGGAIGPPAAVANAVEDALRPFGVVVRRGPLSPSRVREMLRSASQHR